MKINHNLFTVVFVILSVIATGFVVQSGADLTVAELVSTKLFNAAVPMGLFLGFVYTLRGTAYDVLEEIFDQHNIAAAIFLYTIAEILIRAFGRG